MSVFAALGGAAVAVAVACGPGDIGDLTAGRGDAAVASDAPELDSAACIHASPPERPAPADGVNVPPLLFALEDIRFGTGEQDGGPPKPVSLDLDQTCTCIEPESCVPPDAGAPRPCDGPDGRDNVAGPLLASAAALAKGYGPDAIRDQMRAGAFGVLVTLNGWNGSPDDPSVVIGIQLSAGTEGVQFDGGRTRPKLDGSDVWTVTPGSVIAGDDLRGFDCRTGSCVAVNSDLRAYVRGGLLVAHLDVPLPIPTRGSTFQIDLVGATFTARLTQEGGLPRLTGEIAGRWPGDKLLQTFARLRNPQTGLANCASDGGMQIYGVLKRSVCEALDLTVSPGADRTNAPCDALSNAISFTAVRAAAGTIVEGKPVPEECPGFTDTCPR